MMATPAPALPFDPGRWSYEVKWDGYRALILRDGSRVRLMSRNLKDITREFPQLAAAAARLTKDDVIVDGEIVALDKDGLPSFQALQHRSATKLTVVYYAFDLLQQGTVDYRPRTLIERRSALHRLHFGAPILLSEPLPGSPEEIERVVRESGLEGVVAKRVDSTYESGKRSTLWLKVRFSRRQEFVIGGYKPGGAHFDSVLVGLYDGRKFLYAGKVRAGFMPHTRAEVFQRLKGLQARACPFANLPNIEGKSHWGEGVTAEEMLELCWVKPRVVIEVAFTEWTAGGNLRHAAFVGIREDKAPRDVHRET